MACQSAASSELVQQTSQGVMKQPRLYSQADSRFMYINFDMCGSFIRLKRQRLVQVDFSNLNPTEN